MDKGAFWNFKSRLSCFQLFIKIEAHSIFLILFNMQNFRHFTFRWGCSPQIIIIKAKKNNSIDIN